MLHLGDCDRGLIIMKTLLTLLSILVCTNILAQTNYYTSTKTFHENGYTYQCDVSPSKMVTLYNKNNKFTYEQQVYKDTGKPFVMPDYGYIQLTDDDNWTRTKRYTIVKNVFSTEQKQKLSGSELLTILIINATTGKVDEVYFEFHNQDPYKIIPVSVFREIELEVKKNIWYKPTTEGRKLNYILRWWGQDPSEPI